MKTLVGMFLLILSFNLSASVTDEMDSRRLEPGFFGAQRLLDQCQSKVTVESQICETYLAAIFEITFSLKGNNIIQNPLLCLEGYDFENIELRHLRLIYIAYCKEYPNYLDYMAAGVALNALMTVFQCPKQIGD